MNIEEYNAKYEEMKNAYKRELNALKVEYARANNPYKIGDIITDHYQTIRIERISFRECERFRHIPSECLYKGPVLKKDGTLRKDGKLGVIIQSNIQTE